MPRLVCVLLAAILASGLLTGCARAQTAGSVQELFEEDYNNRLVMQVEAAIADAQADYGMIPRAAADEIARTADTRYAPLEEIAAENALVRHRMVALLNVWRRSLSPEAADALHFGVTTVDVYDTVLVLQLDSSIDLMLADMQALEQSLVCLASEHRDTPMIGRTLGQHALPITFGKKASVWLAQNRRNIDRLHEVRARLRSSGVLKGAVGSYLGLGEDAIEIERRVSENLGLDPPEPADWRPARDVFAEYAQVLALIAKSNAAIGGEIFRLQMTDIAEVHERRPASAVGSSTMPHKRNPSLSEALIFHGRVIPALSDIVLADVESVFERDNTSRPNEALADITLSAAEMLEDASRLIARLEVDPERMRANIARTDGAVMSQRVVLFLAQSISRETAEERVREAAESSFRGEASFRHALLDDPVVGPLLAEELDALLDPGSYLGLAGRQVDETIAWVEGERLERGEPGLSACP